MKTRLRKKKFKARTCLSGLDIKSIVIVARACSRKVNTLLWLNALVLYCQSWGLRNQINCYYGLSLVYHNGWKFIVWKQVRAWNFWFCFPLPFVVLPSSCHWKVSKWQFFCSKKFKFRWKVYHFEQIKIIL